MGFQFSLSLLAVVLVVFLLLLYRTELWCLVEHWKECTSGLVWRSAPGVEVYLETLPVLGPPDLLEKNPGGSAHWRSWLGGVKVVVHDRDPPLVVCEFPLCFLPGQRNTLVTESALQKIKEEIRGGCLPSRASFHSRGLQLRAKNWPELFQNLVKAVAVASREFPPSLEEGEGFLRTHLP